MKMYISSRMAAAAVSVASLVAMVAFPLTASAGYAWISSSKSGSLYACRSGKSIAVSLRAGSGFSYATANGAYMDASNYGRAYRTVSGTSVRGYLNGSSYFAQASILPNC